VTVPGVVDAAALAGILDTVGVHMILNEIYECKSLVKNKLEKSSPTGQVLNAVISGEDRYNTEDLDLRLFWKCCLRCKRRPKELAIIVAKMGKSLYCIHAVVAKGRACADIPFPYHSYVVIRRLTNRSFLCCSRYTIDSSHPR
jgi:hypothetical protein